MKLMPITLSISKIAHAGQPAYVTEAENVLIALRFKRYGENPVSQMQLT